MDGGNKMCNKNKKTDANLKTSVSEFDMFRPGSAGRLRCIRACSVQSPVSSRLCRAFALSAHMRRKATRAVRL